MKTFKPQLVAVRNESLVDELKEALADVDEKPEIIPGEQGVIEVAASNSFFFCLTDEAVVSINCLLSIFRLLATQMPSV